MRAWIRTMACIALLGAFVLPACGEDDEPESSPDTTAVEDGEDTGTVELPTPDVGPDVTSPDGALGDVTDAAGDATDTSPSDIEEGEDTQEEVIDTGDAAPTPDGDEPDGETSSEWGNEGDLCTEQEHCNEPLLCLNATCQPKPPLCGDGVLDEGEGCDDGEANSDEVPDACRTSCQPASCGD